MIKVFAVSAWLDVLAYDQSRDSVRNHVFGIVLIPGDDQQRIVRLAPSSVGGNVIFQPCIASSDGSVVHVVLQARDDPANGGQLSEISRET